MHILYLAQFSNLHEFKVNLMDENNHVPPLKSCEDYILYIYILSSRLIHKSYAISIIS